MSGIRTRAPGELEAEVLRILRASQEPLGARDIQAGFDASVPAHTTVLTALDRLVEKGEVSREQISARKMRFRAVRSAAEDASATMIGALAAIGDRKAALLKFAGDLDAQDLALLRSAVRPRG